MRYLQRMNGNLFLFYHQHKRFRMEKTPYVVAGKKKKPVAFDKMIKDKKKGTSACEGGDYS